MSHIKSCEEAPFVVIEMNDGGADSWFGDLDQVEKYLSKSFEKDLDEFRSVKWAPGVMMTYSCGWIAMTSKRIKPWYF